MLVIEAFELAVSPGLGEFCVTCGKDGHLPAKKFVVGSYIADGRMEANDVVVVDILGCQPASILQAEWSSRPDAVSLERLVPAFDFPVGLGVVR